MSINNTAQFIQRCYCYCHVLGLSKLALQKEKPTGIALHDYCLVDITAIMYIQQTVSARTPLINQASLEEGVVPT